MTSPTDAALAWAATVPLPAAVASEPVQEAVRRLLVAAVQRGERAGMEHVVTLVDGDARRRVRDEVAKLQGTDQRPDRARKKPPPW